MQDRSIPAKKLFWGLLCGTFAVMLLLNALTPYLADDFTFSYSFADRDTLHSPFILLRSLYYHYFEWSGRVIVKFFAQLFTIPDKWVFNFWNSAMFALLAWLLCLLAAGRKSPQRHSPLLLGLALASLWLVSPVFGQVNLWMCGSCNNLWSTAGCLAYLLPWRFYLEEPFEQKSWMPPLALVTGILAGWLYENTSAGMLACLVLATAWAGLLQCRRPPLWMLTGLVGSGIGFFLLIAAPGSTVRTDDSAAALGASLWDYVVRFRRAVVILLRYGWPLLLCFGVLLALLLLRRTAPRALVWPCTLFLGGLAAHFAMVISPVYYLRSTHGPFCLMTAGCLACLALLPPGRTRRAWAALAAALGAACLVVLVFAGYDIARYNSLYQERDSALRAAVAAGETELVTYAIVPNTRYCGAYGLPDIREQEDWISITRAMWYGLDGTGLRTGHQDTITADSSTPLTYAPLLGLPIGQGTGEP